MKIISFNVNGVRAIAKKNFFEDIPQLETDILCLQETKATVDQVKETLERMDQYKIVANEADRKGYSGTAILTKKDPIAVQFDLGVEQHDKEGRVITAEYDSFYLTNVYVPNSGNDLRRLSYRQKWDADFLNYLKDLEKHKPVIVCGDFNVAHTEIDLARPKANYNKSAGFMQEEIDGMDAYKNNGLMDTFRLKNPEEVKYSWWSYRGGARERNIGWRIDYCLASEALKDKVDSAFILNDIHGSDHCPVGIKLNT
jgi:exodeoxyribonuclease-3